MPLDSLSPPPSGLSSVPPHPSTNAVQFRELYWQKVGDNYGDLEHRDDWDLVQLGTSVKLKGTPAEILASLDEERAAQIASFGGDVIYKSSTKLLDAFVEPTGHKPRPGSSDKCIFVRSIPESKYSFRLYPGPISAAEYCFDFLDTETGKPVNSPFEYELWAVPDPEAPWLSMPFGGKLQSIERRHGIKQEDIHPGAEKFILRDGQTCVLMRPGKKSLRFTVPVRRRPAPVEAAEEVDVVDLPRVVDA